MGAVPPLVVRNGYADRYRTGDVLAGSLWGFAFEKDIASAVYGQALVDFSSQVAWTIAQDMALCVVYLSDEAVAPSSDTDWDLHVGGVSEGTVRFAAGATKATLIMSADTPVDAEVKVQIYPPSNLHGMTGRMYGTFVGAR